jgi:hypothetical protein
MAKTEPPAMAASPDVLVILGIRFPLYLADRGHSPSQPAGPAPAVPRRKLSFPGGSRSNRRANPDQGESASILRIFA